MVRGLYTAYTGMRNEQKRLDTIANNLANVSTAGYKKDSVANQAFDELMTVKIRDVSEAYSDRQIGHMSLGVLIGEVYTDFKVGSVRESGNPFDLALEGRGFFSLRVVNRDGEETIRYTRDGNFKVTRDGYVVDAYGNNVQGEGGDLMVPPEAAELAIREDGSIFADGVYVDQVAVTDFEDYDYLEKFGDNMYTATEYAVEQEVTQSVLQGFIEQSNVNSVQEMVDMINVTRAYEAGQKVIQTTDDMLEKAVNQVGKV